MQRTDDPNAIIEKGKTYLVPCIISTRLNHNSDEQWEWMDIDSNNRITLHNYGFTPIINHPHNDVENGQLYMHYHKDDRFQDTLINFAGRTYFKMHDSRPVKRNNEIIEYLPLVCYHDNISFITPVSLIKNSKLKHRCIHNGKCPHRGFDLSNTKPDGSNIITCPLHGLKFNSFTKQLIEEHD